MKTTKFQAATLQFLVLGLLVGTTGVAWADVPAPEPRPPRLAPVQPVNNGTLFITAQEGASPAQIELPRAMTRRDTRRSDVGAPSGRIRLALVAGGGTAALLLAGAMGLSRMGRLQSGRMLLIVVGAGISLSVGASVGLADLAVERPQPQKTDPQPVADGSTVIVQATEKAPAVRLVISPEVIRKAIAEAEAAKDEEKK